MVKLLQGSYTVFAISNKTYLRKRILSEGTCRVCRNRNLETIFEFQGEYTFTSAQVPTSITELDVRLCPRCSHVQSRVIENLHQYYDTGYNFHLDDDQTDDLYAMVDGQSVYRSIHQLNQLVNKTDFSTSKRVLDYGCGKAATLQKLTETHPNVTPFVFDVSDAYTLFWNEFVPPENQAAHDLPASWAGQFELVLSFFALEHVAEPNVFMNQIYALLSPGGSVHLLVPHMYQNMNDILVVDHINHFSVASLNRLFREAGFDDVQIDETAHKAALTVTATRPIGAASGKDFLQSDISGTCEKARAIAQACSLMMENIKSHEAAISGRKTAIYGSGIYGMMSLATFVDRSNVMVFLDQNKFRQGGSFLGVPVVAPSEIPKDTECLIVGLNPEYARQIISSMDFLAKPGREFFFL